MPNKQYVAGRRREYEAIAYLNGWGYTCTRAAGSHGLWDIIGWNRDRFVVAQIKANCKPTKAELDEMKAESMPLNTIKMVMIYRNRQEVEIVYL